jgi:hypothetical protein
MVFAHVFMVGELGGGWVMGRLREFKVGSMTLIDVECYKK